MTRILAAVFLEMLEMNRADARKAADDGFEEIRISA